MRVPLCVPDFIDRAVRVYGERTGVVDEPDQPASPLGTDGSLTYAEMGALARRQAARLDELGIARRRAGGGGEPQLRAPADVVLRRLRVGPGAGAGQLPAAPRRGRGTSSSTPGPGCCSSTPSSTRRSPTSPPSTGSCIGDDDDLYAAPGRRAAAVGARRGRHRHHQLHLRHHRAAQGRADHPPQHLDQRGHLRDAHRGHRPRRLPAHAADVPRQRLGHAVRDDRPGRPARRAAQDRRRRDPAPGARPRRDGDVRGARRRRRRAGGRPDLGGRDPRARPGPDHHGRRPAADEDRRAGRGGAGLGVHPDLRPHRDLPAAHDQPHPPGVGRPLAPRSGRPG